MVCQYGSKITLAGVAATISICFIPPRIHWLRCPVDMIDRTAEGLHCGELGQGVASLSCLLSSFFHYDCFQWFLIAPYWVAVTYQSISQPFRFLYFFPKPLFLCLSFRLIKVTFCCTWPYFNVIILIPRPTLNLLSTELQYSLLIQIIPNPPIDATSRD